MYQDPKNPEDAMSRYQVLLLRLRSQDGDSHWFTPAEAARVLCLSTERVRQLIRQNKLPALRTRQGPYLPAAAVFAIAKVRKEEGEAALERARQRRRQEAV